MSNRIHKRFIKTIALFALVCFYGVLEARADYRPYIVELDGAQAGTASTANGTAGVVFDDQTSTLYLRLNITELTGGSPDIRHMARLTDDAGNHLATLSMQTGRASLFNAVTLFGNGPAMLRNGQIRIVVFSPAFPNGEIAGTLKPFTAISARLKGTYNDGDNPNLRGFVSVIYNRSMTAAYFFYKFSGATPGKFLLFDGSVIEQFVPSETENLVSLNLWEMGPDFFNRLRKGSVSVNIAPTEGRAYLRPTNGQLNFDGATAAEPTVFRPSTGVFYWRDFNGVSHSVRWGSNGDIPVPADFDADGRTDLAIWRPSNATFYVYATDTNTITTRRFGMNGDTPLVGDYDGDGRADVGIYRRGVNNGQSSFWIALSNGGIKLVGFGLGNDVPMTADFDGDLISDIAVWRPSDGTFYSIDSSTGNWHAMPWGMNGDQPVVADYDGDLRADYAVARKENGLLVWYVLGSLSGYSSYEVKQWGIASAVPQPADYDGDGRADLGVFVDGDWAILPADGGRIRHVRYGLPTDIALH